LVQGLVGKYIIWTYHDISHSGCVWWYLKSLLVVKEPNSKRRI
jgi:hypothetical protein